MGGPIKPSKWHCGLLKLATHTRQPRTAWALCKPLVPAIDQGKRVHLDLAEQGWMGSGAMSGRAGEWPRGLVQVSMQYYCSGGAACVHANHCEQGAQNAGCEAASLGGAQSNALKPKEPRQEDAEWQEAARG